MPPTHMENPTAASYQGRPLTIRVVIPRAEVARLMGLPQDFDPPASLAPILNEAVSLGEALAEARGAFRLLPPDDASTIDLEPIPASHLAIGLVTIGNTLEHEAEGAAQQGEILRALALEAAGSAAVEEATNLLCAFIVGDSSARMNTDGSLVWHEEEIPSVTPPPQAPRGTHGADRSSSPAVISTAREAGCVFMGGARQSSSPAAISTAQDGSQMAISPSRVRRPAACRFSPGYGSWKLESQALLFALLPADQLGIQLLPSMMMVPRKSISFAMWLGGPQDKAPLGGCDACSLAECRFRRRGSPIPFSGQNA